MRVAISPIIISFLITSALPRPSSSATSRTVAPELTLVASGSAGASALGGGSSSSGRRRRPPRRRGGRCGGGPPIWSRRAACESITTRRFFADAAAAAALLGAGLARTGLVEVPRLSAAGLAARLRRLGALAGRGLRLSAAAWSRVAGAAVALGGRDRLQRIGLLDARGGGFRLDPGGLQRREQLFAAHALRLGDLVNPLLCH